MILYSKPHIHSVWFLQHISYSRANTLCSLVPGLQIYPLPTSPTPSLWALVILVSLMQQVTGRKLYYQLQALEMVWKVINWCTVSCKVVFRQNFFPWWYHVKNSQSDSLQKNLKSAHLSLARESHSEILTNTCACYPLASYTWLKKI